jgi:hypothetical protein
VNPLFLRKSVERLDRGDDAVIDELLNLSVA